MASRLAERAVGSAAVLILLSLIVFALLAVAPGDPARQALSATGIGAQLDERDVAAKRVELGLDRPLPERYLRWWGDLLRLDLGRSYVTKEPVAAQLAARIGASATLAVLAFLLSVVVSLPLGTVAAVRGGAIDLLARGAALLGASLPAFWLALLSMWLFAAELRWVPALGSFTPAGIVLPTLVLALRPLGRLTRLMRATVLEALAMEHVVVARAKGLPPAAVVRRHVVPNALLPVLTVAGLDLALLLGNAAVVEWVFAWPGVGRLAVDAALVGDLPVVVGFVLLMGVVVMAVNLAVDLLYGALDPRLRAGASR